MEEKILNMLKFQDNLNTLTSGENWREGITSKGRVINWKRCIYMELAEAIDSISWKHWKNIEGDIDYENFKIELIDIWHFLMSYLLQFDDYNGVKNLILNYIDKTSFIKLPKKFNKDLNLKINEILSPYEELMFLALQKENNLSYRKKLVEQFFVCLDSAGLKFDDLYKLYIGKNILNKFRQDHGYKEGKYKKVWNGKEDNVVMQEIVAKTDDIDKIYKELERKYREIK